MKSLKSLFHVSTPEFLPEETKFQRVIRILEVDHEPGLNWKELFLQNDDLKPVEPARRKWGWKNFVAFWIADSFNINTWMIVGSYVSLGLSWWEVWISVWVGYVIAASFVTLIGRPGAVYHISFPVLARASFGIFGSFWPVINRVVMACIWYAVQSWIGGECVRLMILSIWPQARRMPNGMSASSGTNTLDFMCFFLFWLGSLPALWFPIHKIRHLFTFKSFCVPIAGFAFLIWALVKAHGAGDTIREPTQLKGSEFSWTWVASMMSCISNFAALIVNNPDFTRFSTKPSSAIVSQMLTIPLGFGITSLIGVLVSSASGSMWGTPMWNPLDVLDMFLQEGGSGNRAGVFFIGFVFTLAQLGTNIAANSASAGTDLTALFPRFINIRRGSYICAAIGIMICPWHLLSSSNEFTSYLSSYSVFLSSIAGVMACDYYAVRKGFLLVRPLYSLRKSDPYWYIFGFSWRAYFSYIAGILINVVGFAGDVGNEVPIGATYIFRVNYFAGFIVAFICYYLLCLIMPIKATSKTWNEDDQFEKDNGIVEAHSSYGDDDDVVIAEEGRVYQDDSSSDLEDKDKKYDQQSAEVESTYR